MSNIWITDLSHFLTQDGLIAPQSGPAKKFAEFLCAIEMMVTSDFSGQQRETEMIIHCRRRPKRKPCCNEIVGFVETETEEILWWCPVCDDNGNIRSWQATC